MLGWRLVFVFTLVLSTAVTYATEYRYTDSWGKQGLSTKRQSTDGISLNFSMQNFSMEDREINGVPMKGISFSESLLPNEEGYPDLPGFSRFIAIPQGSTPILEIVSARTERFSEIDIAPAPRIPLDNEKGPLQYSKNQQVYSKNAFFPVEPVRIASIEKIRGVDVCALNILPYQYNPVTKELIVYRDIEISIRYEGGTRHFGDDRYRSEYWDQILEDAIFNYSDLPVIDYNSKVKNHSRSIGYDYLIIIPNDPIFAQWADSIKNFRNEEGIYTGVVKLSEIGANVNAATLETYVNTAYNTWDIPPTAILLLGDYGSNNATSITSPIYDNYCVSDNILADVDGNHMPDIIFARITAQNAAQLQSMIKRFMDYERTPPTNLAFYQNPITALGWQTERWFQICSEVVGGFWKSQGRTPVRINAVYQGTPGSIWSSATNTNTVVGVFGPNGLNYIPQSPSSLGGWTGGTATMVNNAINAGAFMLMHRDHGNETGWGEPDYQNGNINGCQNSDLTWILSINCLTGKYNWGSECFTEKFHRYQYGGHASGALGLTAASETSYSFVNDTYVWGMMDNMWPEFMPQYGSEVEERGVLPAFGNAAGKYFLKQSNWPYNTGNKEVTYHLFHHHGDAFMRVCTEVPVNIFAEYPNEIFNSDTLITVTTSANAKVCVSVYGEILDVKTAPFSGIVELSIPTQLIGTRLKITITKPDCNRHEGYITVTQGVTAASAGEDITICADQNAQLAGNAINYTSILWETSGTGTFNDATLLNAVYTPGAEDISAGSVVLSLTANNPSIGDSTDYVTLTLAAIPVVNAGNASNICDGDTYATVEATAENYTELFWTSTGTGTFNDANALNTRYTPSAEDILSGNVVLTLNVSNGVCDVHTSDLPVTINPKPVASVSGAIEACQNATGIVYTAGTINNTYAWEVYGGTITSGADANAVTVTWTDQGAAVVTLTETNEFGCSSSLNYNVTLNPAPQPVISGDASACANTSLIYSTPLVEGNTYTWNVEGGNFNLGSSMNEVTVNWASNGEGNVSVIETNSTNNCSTNSAYQVTINSPVINLSDTTLCINHTTTLSVPAGYTSYTWSTGATTNSIQISGQEIGLANTEDYQVTVVDGEGCQTVETIAVTVDACTGLPEGNGTAKFVIFPNPNNGKFSISFNESVSRISVVKIYNPTGEILYTTNINHKGTESFNVSELSSGIYFIKIETETGSTIHKLIIN